ncbi:MAG: hypothetical protein ACI3ZL_08050 [Candidatus Cryptobacteroides sp.]
MRKIAFILTMLLGCTSAFAVSNKKSKTVEPFERGLGGTLTGVFVPKGTVSTGINFNYKTIDLGGNSSDDFGYSMLFGLLGDLKGSMYTFGVAPQVSYFLADNLSLGVRFDYDRSFLTLNSASLSISDDIGFSLTDYNMFQHTFSGSLTTRYYMPLANSKRFGVFVEARATGVYGQSKLWKVVEEDKYGTYSVTLKGALTFVPGICIFATDNVAVEVAIGVLGLEYSRVDQYRNQVEHSVKTTSGANFRINPLSIELGTSFYFYTGPHSKKAKKNNIK